jgi:hypothetical protein
MDTSVRVPSLNLVIRAAMLLALVVGLAVLSPTPAVAQGGRLYLATDVGVYAPATDQQIVRVTIGNPYLPARTASDRQLQSFVIEFDRPIDPVTIGPGESFTYTLDPREVGVDPRPGVRPVRVSFRVQTDFLEGQPAPRPALTIEVLNRRTGAIDSSFVFPGFMGGVSVASGD